jgi:hypothetical protein
MYRQKHERDQGQILPVQQHVGSASKPLYVSSEIVFQTFDQQEYTDLAIQATIEKTASLLVVLSRLTVSVSFYQTFNSI